MITPDQSFYLWLEEEQTGPYTIYQLRGLWTNGVITGLTLYWQEGMPEWLPLSQITKLIEQPAAPQPVLSVSPPSPAKSSTEGVSLRIILYVVFGALAAAVLVASKAGSQGGTTSHSHHYTIRVSGSQGVHFSGSVGCNGQSRTVSDYVPASYDLDGSGCVAVLQKQGGSAAVLNVDLICDYETAAQQSTAAAYGVVQVAAH